MDRNIFFTEKSLDRRLSTSTCFILKKVNVKNFFNPTTRATPPPAMCLSMRKISIKREIGDFKYAALY